jgi:hypothetical protein
MTGRRIDTAVEDFSNFCQAIDIASLFIGRSPHERSDMRDGPRMSLTLIRATSLHPGYGTVPLSPYPFGKNCM